MKSCDYCLKSHLVFIPVKVYTDNEDVKNKEVCPSCLMRLVFIGAEEINKENKKK